MGRHNTHVLNHYHYGHYLGDEDEGTPNSNAVNVANGENASAQDYLRQYGPALYNLLYGKSPEEKSAILSARIRNLKNLKAMTPGLSAIYDPQIIRAENLLQALGGQVYEQQETRFFGTLYKIGGAIAIIGLPIAGMVFLLRLSRRRD